MDKAHGVSPPLMSARQLTLGLDLNHYTSNANYNSEGGSYEEIGENNSYTNILGTLYSRYDLSHRINMMGSLGVAYVRSENTEANREQTSLTEATWGGQAQLIKTSFSLISEAFIVIPFNRIKDNTDEVLTGEGAMVIQAGAWISKRILSHIFYLYLAYKYQDGGRATLFPWSVGFSNDDSPWIYSLELGGFNVLQDDEYINNPGKRRAIVRRVNGGSLKYYSINPEVLEVTGKLGYWLRPDTSFGLGFSQTINGKNYGAGNTIMVHWKWRPGQKKRKRRTQKIRKKNRETGTDNDGEEHLQDDEILEEIERLEKFEIKHGEYDKNLFRK